MENKELIKIIPVISVIFIMVDGVVLTMLKDRWNTVITNVQNKPLQVNYRYAFLTYVLLVFGLYYFVYRHINKESWKYDSMVRGFIFGSVAYGVFDLTNLSILSDYDVSIAVIDTLWGGILSAIVSGSTYYLLQTRNNL